MSFKLPNAIPLIFDNGITIIEYRRHPSKPDDWKKHDQRSVRSQKDLPTWLDFKTVKNMNVSKFFDDPASADRRYLIQIKGSDIPSIKQHAQQQQVKVVEVVAPAASSKALQANPKRRKLENVPEQKFNIPNSEERTKLDQTIAMYRTAEITDVTMKSVSESMGLHLLNYKDLAPYCTKDKILGSGAFGQVFKGQLKGHAVAIKQLQPDKLNRNFEKEFLREVFIMGAFSRHPNLVTPLGYTLKPAFTIVLEFASLGCLDSMLYLGLGDKDGWIHDGRIKKRVASGIINGMIQLHSVRIIHRDLKPANVLISDFYTAKISDFGLSSQRGQTVTLDHRLAGTSLYMAPEVLKGGLATEPIDVYAFGVLLNEIIHEKRPYSHMKEIRTMNFLEIIGMAKRGKRPFISKGHVSKEVRVVLERCWHADPKKRPSFLDIAERFQLTEFQLPDAF